MKSIFKNKSFVILCLLTLLGGILRFWKLGSFPVAPNWDEVSHGVNAYSILLTGKDEWGVSFPLIFRAFGDYKLPLYIYLSTIPVWLFGLGVFSVRFISALAGTLAIPGIYLLTHELFPSVIARNEMTKQSHTTTSLRGAIATWQSRIISVSTNLPLLSAILLAISPWHFFISRPALEANLSLTLIIFGFYFLLRFFRKTSTLLPSVILLGLSLHTYNTARVFVPLMVIVSIIIFRSNIKSVIASFVVKPKQSQPSSGVKNILAIILAFLFSGIVLFQIFAGEGTARYEKLKILSPSAVFQIGESRAQSKLSPIVARLIHNRPVFFTTTVFKNYLGYFSPGFFSQTWGAQFQFAIPKENLLTLPVFLLAVLGLLSSLSSLRVSRSLIFIYSWLLLSPLAGALTIDPPQALRPNPMIPALIIFAALGFYQLLSLVGSKWKTIISVLLALWISISFCLYLKNYFGDYSKKFSSSWQYGYEEVMKYVSENKTNYQSIFITKRLAEPHIFYAFYDKVPPGILQNGNGTVRFEKSDWYWTDKIDNIYFVNDWQIPLTSVKELPLEFGISIPTARSLLVTSPDHIPVNAHIIKVINYLDGSPAFIITSIP